MADLTGEGVADLEMVQDEIFSRLARAYGRSKADIARLAIQRYGDGEMTEKTEEVLSDLKALLQGGSRGGDVMDRMMMWEMIRDMRSQRNNPPPSYQQQPPQQLQQSEQKGFSSSVKEMFETQMMMQMIKSMAKGDSGEKSLLEKIYEYKMLMGEDGKGVDMARLEQMILQERAQNEAKMEQMMNTILGKQEADKLREREEKYKKEVDERLRRAEYMAQHPIQPQDPYQSTRERLDESMGLMTDMKQRMEQAGMVQRPESLEDKEFTKDMTQLKHHQGIETEAVKEGLKHIGKGVDNIHELAKQGVEMISEEQKVRQRQLDMASPEERKRLQKQYEALGAQVMEEQEIEGTMEPEEPDEDVEFSDADDLDATD